eukprot:GEMP01003997.1.p1 GENE.GEMP01003997.1~~GEMP01003997.1.p1  ORF type:complete len:882 (+),score=189.19 GEMP01003997.1:74-2647(+)
MNLLASNNALDRSASGDINRLDVPVPPGAVAGSTVALSTPDGGKLKLTIPAGVPVGATLILEKDETGWKCSAVWDDCGGRSITNYSNNCMPHSLNGHHNILHQQPQKSLSYQPPISVDTPTSRGRFPRTSSFGGRPHLTPYAQRMAQFPPLDSGVLATPGTPIGFSRSTATTPSTPVHRTRPLSSVLCSQTGAAAQGIAPHGDNPISQRSTTSRRDALISDAAIPPPSLPHSTTEHGRHNGLHPALADHEYGDIDTSPRQSNKEQPASLVAPSNNSSSNHAVDDVNGTLTTQHHVASRPTHPSPLGALQQSSPGAAQQLLPPGGLQHLLPPGAHQLLPSGAPPPHVMAAQQTALYSIPPQGIGPSYKPPSNDIAAAEEAPRPPPIPFRHVMPPPVRAYGLSPPRPISIPPTTTLSYVPAGCVTTPSNDLAAFQSLKSISPRQRTVQQHTLPPRPQQPHATSSQVVPSCYGPTPRRYGPPPPMIHAQLRPILATRLSLRGISGMTFGVYNTTTTPSQRVHAVQHPSLEDGARRAAVPAPTAPTDRDTPPQQGSSHSEHSRSDSQRTEPAVIEHGGDGAGAAKAKDDGVVMDSRSGAFGWTPTGGRGALGSTPRPAQDLVNGSTVSSAPPLLNGAHGPMASTRANPVAVSHGVLNGLGHASGGRTHFLSGAGGCVMSRRTNTVLHNEYAVHEGTASVFSSAGTKHVRAAALNAHATTLCNDRNFLNMVSPRCVENSTQELVLNGHAAPASSINNDTNTTESSRKSSEEVLKHKNPFHAPLTLATHFAPDFMTKLNNQYAPRKSFPAFSSNSNSSAIQGVAPLRQPLLSASGVNASRLDSSSALQGQWFMGSGAGQPLTQ